MTDFSPRRFILALLMLAGVAASFACASALGAPNKDLPLRQIDLNAANAKELEELPGIGAVTAQRIIDTREKSGRFRRVEDLLSIRGISPKKLEGLRRYVVIKPAVAAPPPHKNPAQPAQPTPPGPKTCCTK